MEVINSKIVSLRKEYSSAFLNEEDVNHNPFKQFELWMHQAVEAEILEPHAMTVSTVSSEGKPSSRIVLLRGFDENGFVFYTNYESDKGQQLDANPYASLVFFWKELERQVRIEGRCERVSAEESDEYYNSRPLGSKLGAWASPQSKVIQSREILDKNAATLLEQYASGDVPRPSHWGGYRVVAETIEFWQGRSNRLHDRIKYSNLDGTWMIERLAP
jgi:pyridoxamine 5'-phosphate oxidase